MERTTVVSETNEVIRSGSHESGPGFGAELRHLTEPMRPISDVEMEAFIEEETPRAPITDPEVLDRLFPD